MKVLIIGGSGHVSGAVTRAAVAQGWDVTILTRGLRPSPSGVRTLIADRNDADAMRQALANAGDFDAVIDCICYDSASMVLNLELFAGRTGHLLFISTDFVYDSPKRRFPQPEDSSCLENDAGGTQSYGFQKRQCELLLINSKMEWTIFRPCHIYGGVSQLGCFPEHGRDPELIARLRRGETLSLVDGGHFLQQPIDVDDLAATVVSAVTAPGARRNIFNMAGPDIVESWYYYQIIADELGVPLNVHSNPLPEYLAKHPGHLPFLCHRVYCLEKHRRAGLAVPSTPLAVGLRRHTRRLLGI